jgi:hypothetical protein
MSSCFTCKKCLSFAKKTNITELISNFAFLPPVDKNYNVVYSKCNRKKGSCIEKIEFKHKYFDSVIYPWIEIQCFSVLKPSNKKRIIVLRIINKRNTGDDKNTIIFSHGNAQDLGLLFPFLIDLSTQLKVIKLK